MIILPSGPPLRAWREHIGQHLPDVAESRRQERRDARQREYIGQRFGLPDAAESRKTLPSGRTWKELEQENDPYAEVERELRRERTRPLTKAETAKAEIISEVQHHGGEQRAYVLDWGPIISKAEGYVARIFHDFGQEPPKVQWVRAVGPNDDPNLAAKSFVLLSSWAYGMAREGENIFLVRQDRVPESGVVAHESHHILVQRGTLRTGTSTAQMEKSAREFEELVAPQLATVPRIDINYETFALWMRR